MIHTSRAMKGYFKIPCVSFIGFSSVLIKASNNSILWNVWSVIYTCTARVVVNG